MERNSTAKNFAQISVLILVAGLAVIALMVIPADDAPAWLLVFFGTKALAAAGFYAAYRLERAWRWGNKWLQAYERACREAEKASNTISTRKEVAK